jgi:hypothetical protein
MHSLKRVRDSCLKFEDQLEKCICETSDGGELITDSEFRRLYGALNNITKQAEICKVIMRESLIEYRSNTGEFVNGEIRETAQV